MQGRNKSIPVILMTSAAGRPGVWHNEFRLTNNIAFPRALTDNLAKTPITLDLTGGPSKYRTVAAAYDSLTIRGTADAARMPTPGTFFDESLKSEIAVKLHSENIEPARFYFAGDNWSEYATFSPQTQRSRKVYAVFTYKNSESCFYGTAQAVQSFDAMAAKFVTATISLQKDIPIPCTQI